MTDLPSVSHSQIVLWRACQQKWEYRYGQRLVPKRRERPLYVGNWVHAALETHYRDGDWRIGHKPFLDQYSKMFVEEQQALDRGRSTKKADDFEPLPSQVERIVGSYLWYYRKEGGKTLATEVRFRLEVEGYTLTGILDRIYEDDDGLIWVQDHKIWDEIPDVGAFHTMDPQTIIYLHGAKEALGVEATGVEFNYVRSAAPSFPRLNKDGTISKTEVATDYPTLFRWLTQHDFDPLEYRHILDPLARTSPFLQRYRLPRNELVLGRIMADADRSAREILGHAAPVRNITRQCSWCAYQALCRAELFGLDSKFIRSNFEKEVARGDTSPA